MVSMKRVRRGGSRLSSVKATCPDAAGAKETDKVIRVLQGG